MSWQWHVAIADLGQGDKVVAYVDVRDHYAPSWPETVNEPIRCRCDQEEIPPVTTGFMIQLEVPVQWHPFFEGSSRKKPRRAGGAGNLRGLWRDFHWHRILASEDTRNHSDIRFWRLGGIDSDNIYI